MRVLFYTPSSSGTGHLVRVHRLATHLYLSGINSLCLFGANELTHEMLNTSYDRVILPRMAYKDRLYIDKVEFSTLYTSLIETCLNTIESDFFVFTHHYGITGELLPIFEKQHKSKTTRNILLWRDLPNSKHVMENWLNDPDLRLIDVLRNYVDEIWIAGDNRIVDIKTYCNFPSDISEKISHIGYISPNTDSIINVKTRERSMVISFGGGENRRFILQELLQNLLIVAKWLNFSVTIFSGFYWDTNILQYLKQYNVTVFNFSTPSVYLQHVAQCSLLISAGGYNSVVEAWALNTPLIVIQGQGNNTITEVSARSQFIDKFQLGAIINENMSTQQIYKKIHDVLNSKSTFHPNLLGIQNFHNKLASTK